jgi:hypothetical protein
MKRRKTIWKHIRGISGYNGKYNSVDCICIRSTNHDLGRYIVAGYYRSCSSDCYSEHTQTSRIDGGSGIDMTLKDKKNVVILIAYAFVMGMVVGKLVWGMPG